MRFTPFVGFCGKVAPLVSSEFISSRAHISWVTFVAVVPLR